MIQISGKRDAEHRTSRVHYKRCQFRALSKADHGRVFRTDEGGAGSQLLLGHRQDQQQEERRETHGQKCGSDFLDQVVGIERESYAEWLGLGQPFHNLYI